MVNYQDMPLMEITLRRYESPHNLSYRDALKKLCLALGLLQPGDSRDVIVDILLVLEKAKDRKILLTTEDITNEVIEYRKKNELSLKGTAESNIRRQIKRLRDKFLVEKIKNRYRILENLTFREIFDTKIKKFILEPTILRIGEYLDYYERKKEESKNEF